MFRRFARSLYLRLFVLPRMQRFYKKLSVAETFQNIYRTKAWGGREQLFCSGGGSRGVVADKYCESVIGFIKENQIQHVVDLGCGDFMVGKKLVDATGIRYTGIDIVPELIAHLKSTVENPRVGFDCLDIMNDTLPKADLYLVRQVLQHLSNQEISKVLDNLGNRSKILISEDVPIQPKSFNRNKEHGPDVRSYYGSGIYIDKPPFSIPIETEWQFPLSEGTILRMTLIDQTAAK
jgi:SAM-dependent methyltransferase